MADHREAVNMALLKIKNMLNENMPNDDPSPDTEPTDSTILSTSDLNDPSNPDQVVIDETLKYPSPISREITKNLLNHHFTQPPVHNQPMQPVQPMQLAQPVQPMQPVQPIQPSSSSEPLLGPYVDDHEQDDESTDETESLEEEVIEPIQPLIDLPIDTSSIEQVSQPSITPPTEEPPKKRLPKTFLKNQERYRKEVEKKTVGRNGKLMGVTSKNPQVTKNPSTNPSKKIVVGGRIKYVRVDPENKTTNDPVAEPEIVDPVTEPKPKAEPEPPVIRIQKMVEKKAERKPTRKTGLFAKLAEDDIKRQTARNIHNFSDLRRFTALNSIQVPENMDASKISLVELRRLNSMQKQRPITKADPYNVDNYESHIQDILKDDTKSKFAKAVAINNISIHNRRRNLDK